MKKKISLLTVLCLIVIMSLTICVACNLTGDSCSHVDENNDKICDKCYKDMDGSCVHYDNNNDGKCDRCRKSVLVDIDFYAINDLHGMYVATADQPGVDGLTTYLKNKKQNGNVIILSSGDMWQGGSESNNTKGKFATEWLNYIECSSMTLGNHEFDWNTDKIETNAELADFPFLAINVYDRSTNQRVTYCEPSVIVKKGDAKIGIIGAIGNCYSSISASMCQDVYFKVGSELTQLIREESEKLKKQGVDYIVLSIHAGYSRSSSQMQEISDRNMTWYDSSLSDGYVDLVFEAHTHKSYVIKDKYGVMHLQAGGYNYGISHADVRVNFANGKNSAITDIVYNDDYADESGDGIINTLIAKYKDEIGNPDAVIGYNDEYRNSDTLRNAMSQAYMQVGEKEWGENYNIVLAGGYLNVRTPYSLPAGYVTMRQIQTLFPFDNEMHLCAIKGSVLLNRYFNNSDYIYTVGSYGEEVKAKLQNGQGLNDTYYIITDSYNTDYSPNQLTMIKTLGETMYPRDCMAQYIKNGGFGTSGEITCNRHIDSNGDGICDNCNQAFSCSDHVDSDGDFKCDVCNAHIHADIDTDGKCDNCGEKIGECSHADDDNDGICDKCGATIEERCTHVDKDGNGICDTCKITFVCEHIDSNSDNTCDRCQRNLIVTLTFYAINDLHGMYADSDSQPGADELATYLLNAQNGGYSLVLASGDMWQGSTESNNTKGKLATEWMNYINCTSMTLGNHEFDWKTDKIKSNAELANFPFLAINVYEHATNQRATYCKPSTTVTLGGVKIGIIGAIGNCYSSISASMCKDVYFKTGSQLTALVKEEATRLRNEEGVDYIIYSIHDGYDKSSYDMQELSDSELTWYDSSLSDGYVDVVFEGHTHKSYIVQDKYGVQHIQAGGYNSAISQASLEYNILKKSSATSVSIIANDTYAACESDDIVNRLIAKYSDEIGDPDEVVGYNGQYRDYDSLRAIMADAYYQKGEEEWGNDYKIVLAGGFIQPRSPYHLAVGDVTVGQIQTLFPFDNEMHLCAIKGSVLLNRYFNNSDYIYTVGSYGEEVKAKLQNGQGLNDTYYIITDSYNTDYSPNQLTMIKTLGETVYPRDCLAAYIKKGNMSK